MINTIDSNYKYNIVTAKGKNVLQHRSYNIYNSNIADNVSFNGNKTSFLKEIFKPQYIKQEDVPEMVNKFTDIICDLYKSNNLSIKTVKAAIEKVAPGCRINFKDFPEIKPFEPIDLSETESETLKKFGERLNKYSEKQVNEEKEYYETFAGFTYQKKILGYRNTIIQIPFELFSAEEKNKLIMLCNIINHETTHAIGLNTEKGCKEYAKISHTILSPFCRKLNKIYLQVCQQTGSLDFLSKYYKTIRKKDRVKLFNEVIDQAFNDFNVKTKKEKIKVLKNLYPMIEDEAKAYKSTNKTFRLLDESHSFIQYDGFTEFADVIADRIEKEGGSLSRPESSIQDFQNLATSAAIGILGFDCINRYRDEKKATLN